MRQMNKKLQPLKKIYPGILLESKKMSLAVHYRQVNPRQAGNLLRLVRRYAAPWRKQRLLMINEGKKVFEVRPALPWHKGRVAVMMRKKISKKMPTVYLGDDVTDEDAFLALRNQVTIKIGYTKRSAAAYYLRSIGETKTFLAWLGHLPSA